jgi:hypothetical protein
MKAIAIHIHLTVEHFTKETHNEEGSFGSGGADVVGARQHGDVVRPSAKLPARVPALPGSMFEVIAIALQGEAKLRLATHILTDQSPALSIPSPALLSNPAGDSCRSPFRK